MSTKFELCAFADEADPGLDGQIKAMQENGIGYLEMRGVDGKNVAKLSLEEAKEAKKKLDAGGIRVWSIGSPTGKIELTGDFETHLEEFKRMLEIAGLVGASHYRLFSFFGVTDETKEAAFELLRKLINAAKGSSVLLCHENEKKIYGEVAKTCLEIHKALPELKAIFDPANFVQTGEDTLKAWEMLEPYVEYMHIKDAGLDGKVVPAGLGAGNVAALLGRYEKIGGRMLTLEPHLSKFVGLEALELPGDDRGIGGLSFPTKRAAFDAAVAALKKIM